MVRRRVPADRSEDARKNTSTHDIDLSQRIRVGGKDRDIKEVLCGTDLVTTYGLSALVDEASRQPCTVIGLLNTDESLVDIEQMSIDVGRKTKLASFNDYRVRCGYPKLKSFQDLSSNSDVQTALQDCYGNIDNVELYPGLFAEDIRKNAMLPTLMATMVAVDAFSQALNDIVQRNIPGESPKPRVTFNHKR